MVVALARPVREAGSLDDDDDLAVVVLRHGIRHAGCIAAYAGDDRVAAWIVGAVVTAAHPIEVLPLGGLALGAPPAAGSFDLARDRPR